MRERKPRVFDDFFGAAEWLLISSLCGTPWKEDAKGYWPTGTGKPGTWNGGRQAPDEP